MKVFLAFLSVIGTLSCSNQSQSPYNTNAKNIPIHDSTDVRYREVIAGLRSDYVLYYRLVKPTGIDVIKFGMPDDESVFAADSARYQENYSRFINQNIEFVNWLMRFKSDTTNSELWIKYPNPLSSNISECNFPGLSNSRAAIILIENFLGGYNRGVLECFECEYNNRQKCNIDKYYRVETFLRNNRDKSVAELRKAWLAENYR